MATSWIAPPAGEHEHEAMGARLLPGHVGAAAAQPGPEYEAEPG